MWVSDSLADPSIVEFLTFLPRADEPAYEAHLARLGLAQKKHRNGQKLSEDELLSSAFGIYKDRLVGTLPDFFSINGLLVVSNAFKAVIETFRLGETDFAPLSIYEWDRQTRVEGNWFILNFGCLRSAFNPMRSRGNFRPYNKKTSDRWTALILQDDDIAVSDASTFGCDLWIDEKLSSAFFMTENLKGALDAAKLSCNIRLRRCITI